MKKIISSYRIFAPDLYLILGTMAGSVLLCLLTIVMCRVTLPEIALITIPTLLIMLDIMGDFFVFSGVFSKNFEFGPLATSQKGFRVLKMGVICDQLRRLLQFTAVIMISGLYIKPFLFEKGFFSGNTLSYIGFLIVLTLTVYIGNTLVLGVTRRFSNYAAGILPMTVCSIVDAIALFAVESMFMKPEYVNPLPLIITLTVIALIVTYIMTERINLKFMDSFGERKTGRFGDDSKRKIIIFLLVTFGCSFIMIPAMKIGFDAGADLSAMLVAQMMYPACGVVLAKLLSYNEGKLPKAAYVTILLTGMITMILAGVSVTIPEMIEFNGMNISVFYSVASTVIIVVSIPFLIMVIASGRDKRENSGFRFNNAGKSILFVLLFIFLYFAYVLGNMMLQALFTGESLSKTLQIFFSVFTDSTLMTWLSVLINLPLSIIMFVGEEYGWRYFLQPKMQNKFGVALGTILLGIAWGIWHAGADLMFYSTETGLQMIVAQIIACISLGIFMGYAYMKTENIWVPVLMHYFNNNLIGALSGGNPTEAMTGKVISWEMIPTYIISYSVFWVFILTPLMRGKATANADIKEAEND